MYGAIDGRVFIHINQQLTATGEAWHDSQAGYTRQTWLRNDQHDGRQNQEWKDSGDSLSETGRIEVYVTRISAFPAQADQPPAVHPKAVATDRLTSYQIDPLILFEVRRFGTVIGRVWADDSPGNHLQELWYFNENLRAPRYELSLVQVRGIATRAEAIQELDRLPIQHAVKSIAYCFYLS